MNRQRKILITVIYNDLGIIVDTKAEELDLSANLQQTCNKLATDCISRQAAIDLLKKWSDGYSYIEVETNSAIKAFEEMPHAQPEVAKDTNVPNNDCISRQAAIAIVRNRCKRLTTACVLAVTEIEQLPSAQSERQVELDGTESNIEILSELRAQFNCFDEAEEPCYRALSDAICALSAQPERKNGKWIILPPIFEEICQCSKCKMKFKDALQWTNYCPNCGADMREEVRANEKNDCCFTIGNNADGMR